MRKVIKLLSVSAYPEIVSKMESAAVDLFTKSIFLSDLIFGGQITKQEALAELAKPMYDPLQFKTDHDFVLKKLGLSNEEFQKIMQLPQRSHRDFDYEKPIDERYPLLKPVKKIYRTLFPVKK